MKILSSLLKKAIPIGLAFFFVSSSAGCFHHRVSVLPDSETITDHPSIPTKVCLDKGYLLRIYEALERCETK